MSKPHTEEEFSDSVDAELNWRRRELSDLKLAIRSIEVRARPILLKSLITMSYAHWEGYVRTCALTYFRYLAIRKKRYSDLEKQILINSYLVRLDAFTKGRHSIRERCQFIEDVLNREDQRFEYINSQLIDTKSNLNADVISDICLICGVDNAYFEEKRSFIDVFLLKRRNAIAHGQYETISEEDIDVIVEDTLSLMGAFKNLLENKVYTRAYLAA